jgi:aconitate decarboxylase
LLLDGVACALVGAQLPVSRIGVEGVTSLDNAGSAFLIGWGGRTTSAPSAAMLNSSFIQGFELDDYHPLAPLHNNSLVVPAMLAAAPHVGRVSGARFLLGAILGYETGPHLYIDGAAHPNRTVGPRIAAGSASEPVLRCSQVW